MTMLRNILMIISAAIGIIGCSAAETDTIQIASPHLVTPMKVMVVSPKQEFYGEKFPSVYILNGHGGNHTSWMSNQKRFAELADHYKMIFIFPDGRNSWYWDSKKMKMESFFINDLVPYIDSNYPTDPRPQMRAVTGLSMGGHGALWLAIRHPDIWGNAGSISGGLDIRPFPDNWNMKQLLGEKNANPKVWEEHTVMNLVPQIKPGQTNIIIDCGTDDVFTGVNEEFHRARLEKGIPHDYTSRPGAHNWDYWCNSILYHLLFFNEHFPR